MPLNEKQLDMITSEKELQYERRNVLKAEITFKNRSRGFIQRVMLDGRRWDQLDEKQVEQLRKNADTDLKCIEEAHKELNLDGSLPKVQSMVIALAIEKGANKTFIERYASSVLTNFVGMLYLKPFQKKLQRDMGKIIAKHFPEIKDWVEHDDQFGIGLPGVAAIVGEAGDLSNYEYPMKIWKRFGLAVIDGERQRRVANDPMKAIEHGFNPLRRSLMFTLGDSIVKRKPTEKNDFKPCRLHALLEERKEYERGRDTIVKYKDKKTGKMVEKPISVGHIHARAKRYVEKRILCDLLYAWHEAYGINEAAYNHVSKGLQPDNDQDDLDDVVGMYREFKNQ